MTKYKHIPTGTEAIRYGSDEYCTTKGYIIPKFIVECGSDWKEIRDRKPIRQLPDENGKMVDMFEGNAYYYVLSDDLSIGKSYVHHFEKWHDQSFATEAAAEKYVRDNKPVYPAGLVEPLIDNYFLQYNMKVRDGMQDLMLFKDKLYKK